MGRHKPKKAKRRTRDIPTMPVGEGYVRVDVADRLLVPDSMNRELAAIPVTDEEVEAAILASVKDGWVPPDPEAVAEHLQTLVERGWVEPVGDGEFTMTAAGHEAVHMMFRRNLRSREDGDG